MQSNVLPFRQKLYEAKQFWVFVGESGEQFKMSGTLCGCIDLAVPNGPTFCLTPDEATMLAQALLEATKDVVNNSDPNNDPRLYDAE